MSRGRGYNGFRNKGEWEAAAGYYLQQQQEQDAQRYSQGTLYDPAMGNVQGGGVSFKPDGTNHQTYYGDGLRVSHDVNPDGSVSGVHPTDQNAAKNDPGRHL